jgi:hypothetical protein
VLRAARSAPSAFIAELKRSAEIMSKESHRQYLLLVARREAQAALLRNPGASKDDLLALTIQTIEPWKRLIAAVFSIGLLAAGVFLMYTGVSALGPWLLCLGILGLLFSLLGWRKSLDVLSNAIDIGDILDGIF